MPLDLALQYLDIFCSGRDLKRLYALFADDLHFSGPLFSGTTAQAYVEALLADPPTACRYELIEAQESATTALLFYYFIKPGFRLPMAQRFVIRDGKISEILLLFDTQGMTENG